MLSRRRSPIPFDALYAEQSRGVFEWFRRAAGDPEIAADLTAETFARALERYRRVRFDRDDSPAAWLYGIAHNVLREYRRSRRVSTAARERLAMPLLEDEMSEVDARLSSAAQTGAVSAALSGLPPDQRTTLRLRVVEELGYPEIARRLRCSESTARKRVSRALRALQLSLQERSDS